MTKSLRDYISESEHWTNNPVAGDDFAINFREECLVESYVLETRPGAVVIQADEEMIRIMESYGCSMEDLEEQQSVDDVLVSEDPTEEEPTAPGTMGAVAEPTAYDPIGEDFMGRMLELAGCGRKTMEGDISQIKRGLHHAYEVHGNRHGYYVWRKSPISAILNIGITDPRLTGLTSWDPRSPGIRDYVNQHMKPVNFNSLSDDIKELIQKRLPLQRGVDGEWSNRELEVLNKAERDFKRYLDSVSTPSDLAFNAELTKKRMATKPLAGPKGQLPEQQGVAEGLSEPKTYGIDNPYEVLPGENFDVVFRPGRNSGVHYALMTGQVSDPFHFRLNGKVYSVSGKGDGIPRDVSAGTDLGPDVSMPRLRDYSHSAAKSSDNDPDVALAKAFAKIQGYNPEDMDEIKPVVDAIKTNPQYRAEIESVVRKGVAEGMSDVDIDLLDQEIYAGQDISEAEYQGRKVPLGKPMRGDVKKFKVYVKDPKTGNVKKVNFGHGGTSARRAGEKTLSIKKSNPARRKSFRARHNCDNPGPRTKARYWACRAW